MRKTSSIVTTMILASAVAAHATDRGGASAPAANEESIVETDLQACLADWDVASIHTFTNVGRISEVLPVEPVPSASCCSDDAARKAGSKRIAIPMGATPQEPLAGRDDPVWNGALIGGGIGAGVGLSYIATLCANEGGRNCDSGKAYLVVGGFTAAIGAGVGALVDALFRRGRSAVPPFAKSPSARRPARDPVSVSFAPIVSKDEKSMVLSVAW